MFSCCNAVNCVITCRVSGGGQHMSSKLRLLSCELRHCILHKIARQCAGCMMEISSILCSVGMCPLKVSIARETDQLSHGLLLRIASRTSCRCLNTSMRRYSCTSCPDAVYCHRCAGSSTVLTCALICAFHSLQTSLAAATSPGSR